MKRLIMVLVFAAVSAAIAGGYWYWQQSQQAPGDSKSADKAKPKGGKGGRGGPLTVKATRAISSRCRF
ncbi:MAG: hypothetical protein ACO271_09830 [Burkholderiales bacterium]